MALVQKGDSYSVWRIDSGDDFKRIVQRDLDAEDTIMPRLGDTGRAVSLETRNGSYYPENMRTQEDPLPLMRPKLTKQKQARPYSCDVNTLTYMNQTGRMYERRPQLVSQSGRQVSLQNRSTYMNMSQVPRSASQHELPPPPEPSPPPYGSTASLKTPAFLEVNNKKPLQLRRSTGAPRAPSLGTTKEIRQPSTKQSSTESILKRFKLSAIKSNPAIESSNSFSLDGQINDSLTVLSMSDVNENCGVGVRVSSRLCAFHDCHSIVSAWSLGLSPASLDPCKPTGASQAQSPEEADPGDGKTNALVLSCQAFRNELGGEPVRRLGLSRMSYPGEASLQSEMQTWHRDASSSETGVLENLSNVYFGGRLCAGRQPQMVIEPVDPGAFYYRHCFHGRAHQNYFGTDEVLGPVAISLVRETLDLKEAEQQNVTSPGLYRIIIRLSDLRTFRVSVPEDCLFEAQSDHQNKSKAVLKELVDLVVPQLNLTSLKLAFPVPRTEEMLMKLDEQPVYSRYKVGVLYCKAGQSTEEQMYNNEHGSAAFNEFLELIGQKVRLKGFEGYKGGLDTRGDTTGAHSMYSVFQQHHLMFHVSTLLPFTPSNKQQLARKRHIGNDMVTVVFQEPGAAPFSPQTVRSHFQHVFIVVRVNSPCTDSVNYEVAVSRSKDVREFGPPLPTKSVFAKSSDFRDFLLTKIINAENGVHKSGKFSAMAARTRKEVLKDLIENHTTSQTLDIGSKTTKSRLLHSNKQRKDRGVDRRMPMVGSIVRGALAWEMEVDDFSKGCPVSCVLGLSVDTLVLIEKPSGLTVFSTPCHSVIGWTLERNCLKVYYDHGAVLVCRCAEGGEAELAHLISRLESVTKGCETLEVNLRRNNMGQLGFHVQEEGVVTDVEMYGCAWQAGLRQGSRLVEICRISVATLNLHQMEELLRTVQTIKVLVIPPTADGNPRRGCEDAHCPAAKGEDAALAQYTNKPQQSASAGPSKPTPHKLPPTYAEMSKRILTGHARTTNGIADLGYESGSWSRDEHTESTSANSNNINMHNAFAELTISSVSSNEERWNNAPRTDTLSSSGSASSELSVDIYPSQKRRVSRPSELKRRTVEKITGEKYKSEPNFGAMPTEGGPPLPPRTYKKRPSMDQSQYLLSVNDATTSSSLAPIQRCHSEELLGSSISPPAVHSARPAIVSGSTDWTNHQPTNQISEQVIEAAAKVIASSPELGSCQLRLQAALQRVRTLETKVDKLTNQLQKERICRHDLESEVTGLRKVRERLVIERTAAESELKHFTDWVCRAAITSDKTSPKDQKHAGDC